MRVITFGELMLRLAPEGYYRFLQADKLGATFGGGEANVAVSLANYGIDAAFVSKLPTHEIGQAAVNSLRKFGVDTSLITRGGDRVGIYFLEKGASQRPSKVIYDRAHSAIAEAASEDFNWEKIFEGADWFHFTGITPALGDNVADICLEAVKAAKKHGVKIAMETLFEDRAPKGKRARFTSYVNELDDIVSKFGDPIVGICWDFGHARVSHGDEQFEEMRKVGDKIIATHVHDNHWSADMHLLPFEGDTDWNEGMKTLKEIGYNGALTFEMVYGCVPDELIPDYAAWCRKVGEYLISIFENRKQK